MSQPARGTDAAEQRSWVRLLVQSTEHILKATEAAVLSVRSHAQFALSTGPEGDLSGDTPQQTLDEAVRARALALRVRSGLAAADTASDLPAVINDAGFIVDAVRDIPTSPAVIIAGVQGGTALRESINTSVGQAELAADSLRHLLIRRSKRLDDPAAAAADESTAADDEQFATAGGGMPADEPEGGMLGMFD